MNSNVVHNRQKGLDLCLDVKIPVGGHEVYNKLILLDRVGLLYGFCGGILWGILGYSGIKQALTDIQRYKGYKVLMVRLMVFGSNFSQTSCT